MESQPPILEFFNIGRAPYGLVILLGTFVAAVFVRRALEGIGKRFADKRLVIHQVGSFLRFAIYFLGTLAAVLTVVTPTPEVLLAIGGTAAVAIGFALKDLAASIVAGLIILLDQPFQVGDRVTFEGHYGEIREIGLRSVRLVTLDDTLITIPNQKFLTDVVASGNAGELEMMIQVDFHIAADQEVSRAKTIVREALTASRFVHLKRPWTVLVTQVIVQSYFAVRLRAKAYVLDVRFEKAFESDLTERVLEAFAREGIRAPAVLHREAGVERGDLESPLGPSDRKTP